MPRKRAARIGLCECKSLAKFGLRPTAKARMRSRQIHSDVFYNRFGPYVLAHVFVQTNNAFIAFFPHLGESVERSHEVLLTFAKRKV